MLSSKKSFVVTIGNYGSVVALHDSSEIKNKIFLETLTEEAKIDLKHLFTKNQSIPIAVILDTIDQSYKKKTYPLIKKSDLAQIAKRDLSIEGSKDGFKGYIILSDKKPLTKLAAKSASATTNRSECLFVSASNSELISGWLDFLLDMPNRTTGIYMLPVESFSLLELLKPDIKANSSAKNTGQENVYFVILQNKVGGARQIIFSDAGIVFTRLVNYDFSERDFVEKYEHDIYSTFEYLKRLVPDIRISEIDIVNILPNEAVSKIKTIASSELNFVNYTPFEAAQKIGQNNLLPENANFCDLLLSRVFSASKKILKFDTPRIALLEKFFIALKASYYFNIALICFIIFSGITFVILASSENELLSQAESEKLVALQELNNIKAPENNTDNALTENGSPINIERVIDFGKMNELLTAIGTDLSRPYINMRFLKNNDVTLSSFSYSLKGFDYKNPSASSQYSFSFRGDMTNKSGDIDDLFKSFDALTSKTKKIFPNENVKYNEIPHNIDFVQKYYTFPVEFTVSKK